MTQIQLSAPQAAILSTACAREGGLVFPVTTGLKGGAVGNVCKSLLKRGLIEEISASDPSTVWRHDEQRGPITLRVTPSACGALGIADDPNDAALMDGTVVPVQRRKGTKQETLISMLRAESGATIAEIVAATGWQAHTIRGAMSGALKKRLGLNVVSKREGNRGRVYRIDS